MDPIEVTCLELYPEENSRQNHTQDFDLVNLPENPVSVLRRGCNFFLALRFNRDFNPQQDVLRLGFGFGPNPSTIRGTRAILRLNHEIQELPDNPFSWNLAVSRLEAQEAILQVHIPPTVQVGIWHCTVQTNITGTTGQRKDYKHPDDIYILFNPWCSEDSVYLENSEQRDEYIRNETGKIWCGTYKNPWGKPWIFGQFTDIVLPASIFLLDKSGLVSSERGSPIKVTRAISAVVNAIDDSGLLEGRWDGNYFEGTSPHAWTGSAPILDEFLSSGGRPVKYGQCWVYSAVTVTICRALGIPCRSVTNYVSAHDTNSSLTIDKYFDLSGNKLEIGPEGPSNETCWNFHVWNDVWMTRPDLPPGYGGWQIIDSTPQETSFGKFQCGPASVQAVRRGDVGFLYDTPFVFSEVNADVVHFREDQESDWGFSRISVDQYHVGRKILTKRVGLTDPQSNSDLWDITLFYKNPEGTESERLAVYNAIRGVPKAQQFYEIPFQNCNDVSFDLEEIEEVPFGHDFTITVNIVNNSEEVRNISAVLSASSIFYTGTSACDIKKSQGTFKVLPGNSEMLQITIKAEEYLPKLVDHSLIKIYAIANVEETKQTWSEEDDFTLTKPVLEIHLCEPPRLLEPFLVEFVFKNPLETNLTECSYLIEGPGLEKPTKKHFRSVEPQEVVLIEETFQFFKASQKQIVASFTSKQIQGISGSLLVEVP